VSHYDFTPLVISLLAFLVVFLILAAIGAYQKGCQDTWRAADELTRVEPLLPQTEPQPIVLPLTWNQVVIHCPECPPSYLDESGQDQDEQEQAS
jgi:hypothetical protein